MLTQQQYNILKRRVRHLHIKIDLLNQNDIVIDSFEGISQSGSINFQADSTYRRSGSVSLIAKDNSLLPSPNSKLWFNRKIRIYVGLKDWDDSIVWFNQGIFIIQNVNINHNAEGVLIDLECSDLMSTLDGTINGNLSHETKIVPQGVTVAEAIRSTLKSLGKVSVDDIVINDVDAVVPYELNFEPNATVYEVVKKLCDLYMGIEFYFNQDGILIVQKIKDRKFDPVIWDFSQDGMDFSISFQNQINFTNIRNSIYIWGKEKDDGTTVKCVYRNRYARNSITEMNAISDKIIGDICHVINDNESYVWNNNKWNKLSFTVAKEFNIESIGEKVKSIKDENIFTVEQAMLQGEYNLTNSSNFAEEISISTIPLYGLNVNEKIYVSDKASAIEGFYIVKSVSIPLTVDGTMNITAKKLYF